MKKHKVQEFTDEDKERAFWATHDSTDYIDWEKGETVILPNLKPSLKSISIRLPEFMVDELKLLANKRDIPYQSLIKMYLSERIKKELQHSQA